MNSSGLTVLPASLPAGVVIPILVRLLSMDTERARLEAELPGAIEA